MSYWSMKLPEAGPILVELPTTLRRLAAAALWQAEHMEAGEDVTENIYYSMTKYAQVIEKLEAGRRG